MLIPARSISQRAGRILRPGVIGRVLASFERVCDLVADGGEVVALVWDGVGNGPLNVVLAQRPGVSLPVGTRFTVTGKGGGVRSEPVIEEPILPATGSQMMIQAPHPGVEALAGRVVCGKQPAAASSPGSYVAISPIVIDLASAIPWNPQPDWDHLRPRRRQIAGGAEVIAGILAEAGWTPARCGLPEAICERAARGEAAALGALVGLGPGLTPAGDDWLAGWLLAQHLNEAWRRSNTTPAAVETAGSVGGSRLKPAGRNRTKQSLREQIAEIAVERTTTLSRALLACAAAGEGDAEWHTLLAALANEPLTNLPIYQSTRAILSHGATSGAAMLTGFCAGVALLTPDP